MITERLIIKLSVNKFSSYALIEQCFDRTVSDLEPQAFDEFKRHKNARSCNLISGCGFRSKTFVCPFFSLPMLAFSCAHTYYIWGTCMQERKINTVDPWINIKIIL